MPRFRIRSNGNFQDCFEAYARDHGVPQEQMRAHDRASYPEAMLTPFFQWLSGKRLEWIRLNPGRKLESGKDHADFECWLGQLEPKSDSLTCGCHIRSGSPH